MNRLIALGLVLISVIGCKSLKIYSSNLNPQEIEKITVVNPYLQIYTIKLGGEELCQEACDYLNSKIPHFVTKELINTRLYGNDEEIFNSEIERCFDHIKRRRELATFKISKEFESLLSTKEIDYALFIIANGFVQDKNRYYSQLALGGVVAVLSLGSAVYFPEKGKMELQTIIFDRKNSNVAFYHKNWVIDEFLTHEIIDRQLYDLYGCYFKNYSK